MQRKQNFSGEGIMLFHGAGRRLCLATAILLSTTVHAQESKPLTNQGVIEFVKAGFDEDTVIKAIEASEPAFDTSLDGLVALKNAGVSQRIIGAMLDAEKRRVANANNGAAEPAWPEEIRAMPREIGAYYKQKDGTFVGLFGKPIVGTKAGRRFGGFVPFAGATMKGQLPGRRSTLQLSERQPAFYTYMPEGVTPESFVIVRMQMKDNAREFEVGSVSGVTGSVNRGLDTEKVIQILIERVAPRVYKVSPDRELEDGEYGFLGSFTMTAVGLTGTGQEKVYDFGVSRPR